MQINRIRGKGLLCVLLAAGLVFSGCSRFDANAVLVKIPDSEDTVSLGYYNFAAKYQQSVYDVNYGSMMGEDMWTQDLGGSSGTMEDSVKNSVLEMIEDSYVSRQHAKDYDIEISDKELEKINEAADAFLDDNKPSAIKAMGATKEYLVQYLSDYYITTKLQEAIEAETEVNIKDEDAVQAKISYALYSTAGATDEETGETTELSEEEIASIREEAEALVEGGDLDAFGEEVSTYTYTYAADPSEDTSLGEEVIKAANELEEGQLSPVIEVEGKGFYVVRMDSFNDKEATDTKREALENQERMQHYTDTIDGWRDAIEWEVDEALMAKVKFDTRFNMSSSMQEKLSEVIE